MANSIERYTGSNPNGNSDIMSKITVTAAGFLNLAVIPAQDSYTLRLWVRASGARIATAYIGASAFSMPVLNAWKEFTFTAAAGANTSAEIYLPTGTYLIWHPKLECSTKPSDYTESPEDVSANITAATTNAVEQATAYTAEALREYATTEQMHSEIRQTKSEITVSVSQQITETKRYAVTQADNALTAAKDDTNVKLRSYVTQTQHSADLRVLSDSISSVVTSVSDLRTYVDGDFASGVTSAYTSAINQKADTIESSVRQTYATINTVNNLTTRVTQAESSIQQNADSISATVRQLATAESNIAQNADSISTLVTTVSGHTTRINQNADSISSLATTVNGHTSRINQNSTSISSLVTTVDGHTASITQNANAIALRVKTADLVSEINASSGTISMRSNRFTVDSTNFKLTAAGNITANNATLSNASVTGSLKSGVDSSWTTQITGGKVNFSNAGILVAQLHSNCNTNSRGRYLGILGTNGSSNEYGGIVIGRYDTEETYTSYYRCNTNDTMYNYFGECRHLFGDIVRFTDGGIKFDSSAPMLSNIPITDNFGLSWGGNIGIRYANTDASDIDTAGLYVGIGSCGTFLKGTSVHAAPSGNVFLDKQTFAENGLTVRGGKFYVDTSQQATIEHDFGVKGGFSVNGGAYFSGGTVNINNNVDIYTNYKLEVHKIQLTSNGIITNASGATLIQSNSDSVRLGGTGISVNIAGALAMSGDLEMSGNRKIKLANDYGIYCGDNRALAWDNTVAALSVSNSNMTINFAGRGIKVNGTSAITKTFQVIETVPDSGGHYTYWTLKFINGILVSTNG